MDLTRFIGTIDDELQCQICTSVLEDPIQTPCEHYFCNACIKHWLSVDEVCPVDRLPLTTDDLRPPSRLLRNLLGKLEIRCDFREDGCPEIVRLENLQKHRTSCVYNPEIAEVTCFKGCNLIISRHECITNNCMAHLASKIRSLLVENSQLAEEVRSVKAISDKEIIGLRQEISNLNDQVTQQRVEITKLKGTPVAPIDRICFSFIFPLQWQRCDNIRFERDKPRILQCDNQSSYGLVQSAHYLEPHFDFFEIQILKCGGHNSVTMGLTRKGCSQSIQSGNSDGCISYRSSGEVNLGYGHYKKTEEMWKEGDVIRCGIKLSNVTCYGNTVAIAYFAKNGKDIKREFVNYITAGYFPTVYIRGSECEVNANL